MTFSIREPINQIDNKQIVRHEVQELKDNCLVQRCIHCNEIIEDYTGRGKSNDDSKIGLPSGYVYVNKSGDSTMTVTQMAIRLGLIKTPDDFVDCTIVYS